MFRKTPKHGVPFLVNVCLLFFLSAIPCLAQTYDAFLEPNRIVDISSPYRGRISVIHVRDGDQVKTGQLLAELDSQVLKAQLASAGEAALFHGRVDSAIAMVSMRKNRYAMLKELEKSGNARPQEMARGRTDLIIARAELLGAKEDQKLKKLEADIIRARIEENKLRSPVDGVVTKIYKEEAELIGGTEQQGFITVVQLDPLQAQFHLPPDIAANLTVGSEIVVEVDSNPISAEIDFISPIINAQSGTIEVRLTIENKEHLLASGRRCIFKDPVVNEQILQNTE
jgi:RND family efflux transporter MFP subunit